MTSHDQLHLNIRSEFDSGALHCRGIFTLGYLHRHFTSQAPSVEAIQNLHVAAKARWEKLRIGLERGSESYLRSQWLDWLLHELGWYFIPEQKLPKGLTAKRPDYCLFLNEGTQLHAAEQTQPVDVFRESATVVEAKRMRHALDRASEKETPGLFPSQQVQDYLRRATDATGRRFFNWAILTNGAQWRLYCHQAPPDSHFAFHLIEDGQFCPLEEFRFFVALFGPAAFTISDERCLLDDLRESSLTAQADLEFNLRKRIFDVLEELATAFWQNPNNKINEANFQPLYDASLILLYRLLFVLYAESRDLLPAKPTGPGANKTYREKFSLTRLVGKLRDRNSYNNDAFSELYDDLLKLFRLINGDNRRQNEACNVTRYNGGLFRAHAPIDGWRIGDKSLANVLRQLIFAQPPARATVRQQQISTDETIDYSTLEVRQLGDIYEGLLGAELRARSGRLELVNENGENHRHGIYYTPDWIVRYLLRESLQPLLDEIQASPDIKAALTARSDEKRRDNSFAQAVLQLNLVDPAMGSGHFLVRATEWLADRIREHPTTRLMTEQIVTTGDRKRSKEDIVRAGKIPVPLGIPQEEAEKAYWRRRVVEACIYGADINPMAVELAKLSLWLTCIAADEPLNFLDHHLRHGNSLLFAKPDELRQLRDQPAADDQQVAFDIGGHLQTALRDVIEANVNIEVTASTEMEIVKDKEDRWKKVRTELDPFFDAADLWLAALSGLPVNDLQYRLLVLGQVAPDQLPRDLKTEAARLRKSFARDLAACRANLAPFHWELEFPDVFFQPDGQPRPDANRGFDCLLGNPPYISTHTSAAQDWRSALERRAGYLEDLYVHFTDLGFQLLRPGGAFGFVISDTFFTLNSKLRVRELLQTNRLTHLGQCDPFDATVDAAIFVARKGAPADDHRFLFVQARPRKDATGKTTAPEDELPDSPTVAKISWEQGDAAPAGGAPGLSAVASAKEGGRALPVRHGSYKSLRLHQVPLDLYRRAHKRVFFEPRPATLQLFHRFNEAIKELHAEWWERIETSQKFADNLPAIRVYHRKLKPGDITLVGLIAEGGQGMRTANNARFLGYLDGTPQAGAIRAKRQEWTDRWQADPKIKPVFVELLKQNGGNPAKPTANSAAWEACIEPLKARFAPAALGFTKSDLYRIVPPELVATAADFQFAWQQRKAELLQHWKNSPDLRAFWDETRLEFSGCHAERPAKALSREGEESPSSRRSDTTETLRVAQGDNPGEAETISDADFCTLCQQLQAWAAQQKKLRHDALGLRSSENYTDPADAPRIATIYHGLAGHGQFVPFRKGDPSGNRWADNEPLHVEWSKANVNWFFENSGRPESGMPVVRNAHLYFTSGVTWTAVANHVAMKARFQEPCVFDADSMRLTPVPGVIHSLAFLALLNSDVVSFCKMKFIKHTQKWEIGDLRQLPLVMPTRVQEKRLTQLAEWAVAAKRLTFANAAPPNELVAALRGVSRELQAGAPVYLRPPAQAVTLQDPADCLAILERAINWEAEKLYGVEGAGPFDEF